MRPAHHFWGDRFSIKIEKKKLNTYVLYKRIEIKIVYPVSIHNFCKTEIFTLHIHYRKGITCMLTN